MDTNVTKQFIIDYPNFSSCLIQVFDDVEGRKDPKLAMGALRMTDNTWGALEAANTKGCGVFFTVNPISGNERKQSNVSWVNARVAEIDGMSKQEQLKLIELSPIPPSIIVESKRSYQIYFFANDAKLENRRKIMRGVRNFFDWDHKIITEERVLRLPWYNHCKNIDDQFEVWYTLVSSNYYTEMDMLLAFPDCVNKLEQAKQLKAYTYEFTNDWGFRNRVKQINARTMLEILSWTKRVNWQSIEIINDQIRVDKRSTSSWIDEKWLIGSHDNWWPFWTNWVTWYGTVDWKELYQWVWDKFPELKDKPKKQELVIAKQEIIPVDDFFVPYDREHKTDYKAIVPFTFGNDSLDSYFWRIEKGRFMTTVWESGSWKTTRAFHQWLEISKKYKVLFVSLEMTWERVIELRAMKMTGITKQERDDKQIPLSKIHYMEKMKREIMENTSMEIVGVNKKADGVFIERVIEALSTKYISYDRIIIDNLWFIKSREADLYKDLNTIVRSFKVFCERYNKNVNLLHHFRKWESKARRDRTFADILGTGKLEHDVDYAIFILRHLEDRDTLTDEQKQEVFIKIAKDRDHGEQLKKCIYFYKWRYYDDFQPTWIYS